MNILIDLLPTKVEIGKKMYKINSDFRTSILFELLMYDDSISDEFKCIQALELYYPSMPPERYFEDAIHKILWFYSCGKENENKDKNTENSHSKVERVYSYEYDDSYIYSAFLSQYNIDLQDINDLHWWKFKAMFESLKEDNKICEIMKYRASDLSKIKDKEEKAFYKKMKQIYKLPEYIDKEQKEKEDEIAKILMGDGVLDLDVLT
ncbi:MAG: bacteriophage Gp15 family protein [Paeniclostridium sordellii]|uniref:bacteriophage Gp15 family protein n=1 Tax=Paraclostridium sordellii TaxID=1505 RepID=UPI001F055367|nr:bacteriophage Gp15 family protein [Paeniclostridium sordellii]MCH1965950.1 bacteriophage Gp15 family protein [Paeniclostridium sordellii]MDU6482491.1 bacteriophage Gp15 family protein [Paeniclostridium sordellii]